MNAIFDVLPTSIYDDSVAFRYEFPKNYLSQAREAIGDWILYRRTRRSGKPAAYVGVARLHNVDPVPNPNGLYYANVINFTPFNQSVPFFRLWDNKYWERELNGIPREQVGRTIQGRSIRHISPSEFGDIVYAGFAELFNPSNAPRLGLDSQNVKLSYGSLALADAVEKGRKVTTFITHRKVRDANFRGLVLDAYDNTCAISGLRIVNGLGRAEANAAHIKPVADDGPDIVRNGLALSSTCHWVFDRHLVSLTDECEIIHSKDLSPALTKLLPPEGEKIQLPSDSSLYPNPEFLAHHRRQFEAKW